MDSETTTPLLVKEEAQAVFNFAVRIAVVKPYHKQKTLTIRTTGNKFRAFNFDGFGFLLESFPQNSTP